MKIRSSLFLITILFSFAGSHLHAEEVRNGDFTDSARFWFVLVNGGFRDDAALASFLTTSGEGLHLKVKEIPGDKAKPAAVTLNQRVRSLSEGVEYVLRFEAKGTAGESMLVGFGKPVDSGPNRANQAGGLPVQQIALQEDWQESEFSFVYNSDQSLTLPDDAEAILLQFRVGTLTELHLRSVSVTAK